MWVLNAFLYLCWIFNQPMYEQLKENGAPCYALLPGTEPESAQPECWYDPTNVNPATSPLMMPERRAHR